MTATATRPCRRYQPPRRARRTRRLTLGLIGCIILLAIVCALSLCIGSKSIPLSEVWRAFTDDDSGLQEHIIVRQLRQPRTLIGLIAGACLGLSGAVMQGLTHNPLADPGILGIDAGAAFAVVIAIHSFDINSASGFIWFAFVGAAFASVLVYGLGNMGRHAAAPVRLALAGMATAAVLGAFTTSILLRDDQTLDQYRFWVVGSLSGRDMAGGARHRPVRDRRRRAVPAQRPLAEHPGARRGHRPLTRAHRCSGPGVVLGGDRPVGRHGHAACGPIGFVGLTVPHLVRRWTGPEHRWLLPYSTVVAPTLLLGADIIGRVIDRPSEVQVGIITALLGAPFFVIVARRTRISSP